MLPPRHCICCHHPIKVLHLPHSTTLPIPCWSRQVSTPHSALGVRYHCTCKSSEYHACLLPGDYTDIPPPLPDFFKAFPSTDPTVLTCFVDAAYANDPRKRRSTTGYALMMAGGAVVYRSKTQAVTALSCTEAEFFAAVYAQYFVNYTFQ